MTDETVKSPLVSVVMPFLNAERFIEESIQSVFAQTYEHWELLLVDDGSTDDSTAIAKRHAGEIPGKVRYLEHDGHRNRKASATRNLGIRNARGAYIALLDADDVWLPEKLRKQVTILQEHPEAAMVYGPSLKWYSWSGRSEDVQRDVMYVLGVETDRVIEPPRMLLLSLQDRAIVPSQSSILFSKEMIERVGGYEESFTGTFEDHAFMAKVHLREAVFAAGECWDKYRRHPDSNLELSRKEGKADTDRLFFLRWLEKYLSGLEMQRTEVWQALQTALRPYRHAAVYRLRKRARRLFTRSFVQRMLAAAARRSPGSEGDR